MKLKIASVINLDCQCQSLPRVHYRTRRFTIRVPINTNSYFMGLTVGIRLFLDSSILSSC